MLRLDDRDRTRTTSRRTWASGSGARPLRAGGAALAAARDGAPVPGAAAAAARASRARRVQSVRCRSLPFRPAAERGAVRSDRIRRARRLRDRGSRASTRRRPEPDRAAVRQGVGHEDERPGRTCRPAQSRPARSHSISRWRRRTASRPHRRDLRPRVLGQDDARLPRDRRGAAAGRHLRLHRRRACDGPDLRAQDRRQHRRPARLAARHTASRRSRSPSCSSARARSTSSPSTRSPR